MMTKTNPLADLTGDGDTVTLADGRTLRLRIESDPDTDVNDFDCYGKVARVQRDRDTGHDKPRPEGFTGRARKLWAVQNGNAFWWEPSPDLPTDAETMRSEEWHMRELMAFGFRGVILEVLDGEDAYGRPIVIDTASLWGIDSLEDDYLATVLADLVGELDVTL